MKYLFVIILFFSFGAAAQTCHPNPKKYSIKIIDQDYSMAYTTQYHIFNDSLVIVNIGGIESEQDSCIVNKKINESQTEKVYSFLCSLNIMKLKNKYENPFVEDGDRKMVTICFNNIIKTVEINNFYQKDIANLFDVINQIIGTEFKIVYRSR